MVLKFQTLRPNSITTRIETLYYAGDNSVKSIDIPIEKNVMNIEHLEIQKEKDERIQAFIDSFQEGGLETISFEDNLRLFFSMSKNVNRPVFNRFPKA